MPHLTIKSTATQSQTWRVIPNVASQASFDMSKTFKCNQKYDTFFFSLSKTRFIKLNLHCPVLFGEMNFRK